MKESVTYQAILEEGAIKGRVEGRVEGEQQMLLHMGTLRLGKPSPWTEATIRAIDSADRLMDLVADVLAVESWDELLPDHLPR